jgi:hypothetical protein
VARTADGLGESQRGLQLGDRLAIQALPEQQRPARGAQAAAPRYVVSALGRREPVALMRFRKLYAAAGLGHRRHRRVGGSERTVVRRRLGRSQRLLGQPAGVLDLAAPAPRGRGP